MLASEAVLGIRILHPTNLILPPSSLLPHPLLLTLSSLIPIIHPHLIIVLAMVRIQIFKLANLFADPELATFRILILEFATCADPHYVL